VSVPLAAAASRSLLARSMLGRLVEPSTDTQAFVSELLGQIQGVDDEEVPVSAEEVDLDEVEAQILLSLCGGMSWGGRERASSSEQAAFRTPTKGQPPSVRETDLLTPGKGVVEQGAASVIRSTERLQMQVNSAIRSLVVTHQEDLDDATGRIKTLRSAVSSLSSRGQLLRAQTERLRSSILTPLSAIRSNCDKLSRADVAMDALTAALRQAFASKRLASACSSIVGGARGSGMSVDASLSLYAQAASCVHRASSREVSRLASYLVDTGARQSTHEAFPLTEAVIKSSKSLLLRSCEAGNVSDACDCLSALAALSDAPAAVEGALGVLACDSLVLVAKALHPQAVSAQADGGKGFDTLSDTLAKLRKHLLRGGATASTAWNPLAGDIASEALNRAAWMLNTEGLERVLSVSSVGQSSDVSDAWIAAVEARWDEVIAPMSRTFVAAWTLQRACALTDCAAGDAPPRGNSILLSTLRHWNSERELASSHDALVLVPYGRFLVCVASGLRRLLSALTGASPWLALACEFRVQRLRSSMCETLSRVTRAVDSHLTGRSESPGGVLSSVVSWRLSHFERATEEDAAALARQSAALWGLLQSSTKRSLCRAMSSLGQVVHDLGGEGVCIPVLAFMGQEMAVGGSAWEWDALIGACDALRVSASVRFQSRLETLIDSNFPVAHPDRVATDAKTALSKHRVEASAAIQAVRCALLERWDGCAPPPTAVSSFGKLVASELMSTCSDPGALLDTAHVVVEQIRSAAKGMYASFCSTPASLTIPIPMEAWKLPGVAPAGGVKADDLWRLLPGQTHNVAVATQALLLIKALGRIVTGAESKAIALAGGAFGAHAASCFERLSDVDLEGMAHDAVGHRWGETPRHRETERMWGATDVSTRRTEAALLREALLAAWIFRRAKTHDDVSVPPLTEQPRWAEMILAGATTGSSTPREWTLTPIRAAFSPSVTNLCKVIRMALHPLLVTVSLVLERRLSRMHSHRRESSSSGAPATTTPYMEDVAEAIKKLSQVTLQHLPSEGGLANIAKRALALRLVSNFARFLGLLRLPEGDVGARAALAEEMAALEVAMDPLYPTTALVRTRAYEELRSIRMLLFTAVGDLPGVVCDKETCRFGDGRLSESGLVGLVPKTDLSAMPFAAGARASTIVLHLMGRGHALLSRPHESAGQSPVEFASWVDDQAKASDSSARSAISLLFPRSSWAKHAETCTMDRCVERARAFIAQRCKGGEGDSLSDAIAMWVLSCGPSLID
jgi:hypothetical protein